MVSIGRQTTTPRLTGDIAMVWRQRRLRRSPLRCVAIVELVTDYLEGALSPAYELHVVAHLQRCEGCRNYLEQIERTVTALGSLGVTGWRTPQSSPVTPVPER